MAIRLLRESSEAPNITNKDDVRMIRYAYGGYNGVVQKYGEELAGSASGGTFRIGSGRVVLHGWEVEVDGAGWVLDLSSMSSGIYYYTVYLEVNAELETVEIRYLYDTAQHPVISPGDDLTEVQSGTSRLELFNITVSYGIVSSVSQVVPVIKFYSENRDELNEKISNMDSSFSKEFSGVYNSLGNMNASLVGLMEFMDVQQSLNLPTEISSIKARLDSLGFKQGSCTYTNVSSVQVNSLKKQGRYVILDFVATASAAVTLYVPAGFRPKSNIPIVAKLNDYAIDVTVGSNGIITIGVQTPAGSSVSIRNIGWETADN